MSDWKDATSYRQGQERIPNAWNATCGEVSIWIGTGHLHNQGRWTMHCHALGINIHDLGLDADQPPELAQQVAKNVAANKARKLASDLAKIK